MEAKASTFLSCLLIFVLAAAYLQTGLAAFAQEPASGPAPQDRILAKEDIQECYTTLYVKAPACLTEILKSFATGRLGLGPICCEAIYSIGEKCWKGILPVQPIIPPFIQTQCAGSGHGSPQPSKIY